MQRIILSLVLVMVSCLTAYSQAQTDGTGRQSSVDLTVENRQSAKVTILDKYFNVVRVIEPAQDMARFFAIWDDRSEIIIDGLPAWDWDYKIDIATKAGSTRYLYSSKNGVCSVLSKSEVPVYQIYKFELLNAEINPSAMSNAASIWLDEPLKVSFATDGYAFYKGSDGLLGMPVEAFLKLVAVKGEEKVVLPKTTDLKGRVNLKTPAQALEFVRLFTDINTQYLFQDIDVIEVRNSGTDVLSGELGPGYLLKSDFEKLGLFEPKVQVTATGFIIERCLLNARREIFHSRETLGMDGAYKMEVVRVIQPDSRLYLPMYE